MREHGKTHAGALRQVFEGAQLTANVRRPVAVDFAAHVSGNGIDDD
jgi:hypothetical protein